MFRVCIDGNCEIHGVRHVVRDDYNLRKRLAWLLLVVLALGGFVILASFRIHHYFDYQYISTSSVEEGSYPIPAISVCAYPLRNDFPRLPLSVWASNSLSDQEAIEFAWLHYGISVSTIDVHTGELILEESAMGAVSSYYQSNSTDRSTTTSVFTKPLPSNIEESSVVIRRLLGIKTNFRKKLTANNLYKSYGMKLEDVTCVRIQGYETMSNCMAQVYRRFMEFGPCVTFDAAITGASYREREFNGKFVEVQNFGDVIKLEINFKSFNKSQWDMIGGLVYNPGGMPSWNFQRIIHLPMTGIVPQILWVEKFVTTHRLGPPYRHHKCEEEMETACIQKCWSALMNCSLVYFHMDLGYHPCPLEQQMWWKPYTRIPYPGELCLRRCSYTCTVQEFSIKESMFVDSDATGPNSQSLNLRIAAARSFAHHVITEQPLYTYDALLCELGGTLGLFVGASVLTVIYGVDVMLSALRRCMFKANLASCRH